MRRNIGNLFQDGREEKRRILQQHLSKKMYIGQKGLFSTNENLMVISNILPIGLKVYVEVLGNATGVYKKSRIDVATIISIRKEGETDYLFRQKGFSVMIPGRKSWFFFVKYQFVIGYKKIITLSKGLSTSPTALEISNFFTSFEIEASKVASIILMS